MAELQRYSRLIPKEPEPLSAHYLSIARLDSSLLYSASSAAARAKFLGKLPALPFGTFVTLLHVGHL